MERSVIVVCLVVAIAQLSQCARILGVFAHHARSNSLITHAAMSALAAAGHDVTVYSHFTPQPGAGFHHVLVEHTPPNDGFTYQAFIDNFSKQSFLKGSAIRMVSYYKCEAFFKHPRAQELLNSTSSYDLVFTGAPFGEESLLVFGHKFNAATISILPSAPWAVVNYMAGNALSLAHSPEYILYPFSDHMTFLERVRNVVCALYSLFNYFWRHLPGHDAILKQYASHLSPPPPPVDQMVRDIALTFMNVHPTVGYPRQLPPNIIPVGGIHFGNVTEELPKDIQRYMDDSSEGVVYFSLGSIVPIKTMPDQMVQSFVDALKKLPLNVIWQTNRKFAELPANIKTISWLPQPAVLAHPNCVLFLTHGGLGSQLEALHAGVPVVGLPFFSDQPHNVRLYETLGVGEGLSLDTLSEAAITTALHTVLSNRSYTMNAKRVSRVFRDRPQSAAASVVYWTEYVLRHGGAHLRPQAALLPWYQRTLLDVLAASVLGLGALVVFVWRVGRAVTRPVGSYERTRHEKIK